jgi:hypothetical protein
MDEPFVVGPLSKKLGRVWSYLAKVDEEGSINPDNNDIGS